MAHIYKMLISITRCVMSADVSDGNVLNRFKYACLTNRHHVTPCSVEVTGWEPDNEE